MSKRSGRNRSSAICDEAAGEVLPIDETERLLAEMDDTSLWDWENAEVGPGFYRPPSVGRQLADAVRAYRAAHSLTQEQLGRLLMLHQSQIARLEAGQHTPELETLVRLARHLGLTLTVQVSPTGAFLSVASTPAPAGEFAAG
ncbi:MAG: helix-turn-helix domain-containing protein [Chloroflexi bacterium]|nr:helix-turn-helix domain-containing protein [Chloroflexota bacterium]